MAEEGGVTGVLDRYSLDALVMPTFASFHLPAIAGLPVITVPLGYYPSHTPVTMNLKGTMVNVAPNVPFGIAFVGRRWSEETLISFAYAFEQRTMTRKKIRPYVRPTFELGDQTSNVDSVDATVPPPVHDNTKVRSETMQATVKRIVSGVPLTRNWYRTWLGLVETLL